MNFGDALARLQTGWRVHRTGWSGTGLWVALAGGDGLGWAPYLYMQTADGTRVPWVASQTDILAEDWSASKPKGGAPAVTEPPSDIDKAAGRVVLAFANRGDDLFDDLLGPMQDLDEALDRAGRLK